MLKRLDFSRSWQISEDPIYRQSSAAIFYKHTFEIDNI